MPKEDLPPPEGMSEEKYCVLLMMEKGCQICKSNKECKIYMAFYKPSNSMEYDRRTFNWIQHYK